MIEKLKALFSGSDEDKKLQSQNDEVLTQLMALVKAAQTPANGGEDDLLAQKTAANLNRIRQESSGQ